MTTPPSQPTGHGASRIRTSPWQPQIDPLIIELMNISGQASPRGVACTTTSSPVWRGGGESGDNFLKRQEHGGGDRNHMKQANRDHWLCSEIHCEDQTHTVFLISDPTMMTLLHSQLLLYMQSMMSDKKQTHAQTHGVD